MYVIQQDESGFYYCQTNKAGCWKNWEYADEDGHYLPYEEHILANAEHIYDLLSYYGYSHKPICAILGNMIAESTMNPAQGEIGKRYMTGWGYGLCQWTPATKYTDWAKEYNHNACLGTYQLQFLDETGEDEWIINPNYSYNITWDDFIHYEGTEYSIEWLTMAFLRNYERGVSLEEYRENSAVWYDDYFGSYTPETPPEPSDWVYKRYDPDHTPLWMMLVKEKLKLY